MRAVVVACVCAVAHSLLPSCAAVASPQDPADMLFPDERSRPPSDAAADERFASEDGPWRAGMKFAIGVTSLDYVRVPDEDFDGAYVGLDLDFGLAPFSGPLEFGVRLGGRAFGVQDPSFRGNPTDISGATGLLGGYLRFDAMPDDPEFGIFAEGFAGRHATALSVTALTAFSEVTGEIDDGGAWFGLAGGVRFRTAPDGPSARVALVWERAEYDDLLVDQDSIGVLIGFEQRF